MIGNVVRGANVGGLLRYLYGPGRANEHTDPHLVAGFGDPQELEPDRRADGSPDLRRLTGLLLLPLALDPFGGPEKPVWHCSVRAAPGDRMLSDAEWGQVAVSVIRRTGYAPEEDEREVRWVAVRHAPDHVHIVATLARRDGGRVKTWNDFFRVREACRAAERRLGLTATAPADRTAAKRASRAETEQAARRGWDEAPRVSLRREVCAAAAGAGSEREFFARLEQAGVLVRKRLSTGDRLRAAARLVAMAGSSEAGTTPTALHLAASLVRLAGAVGELRQAQQHATQAAAARKAAEGLHAALSRSRAGAAALGIPTQARPAQTIRKPGGAARPDFPVRFQPGPLAPQSSGHVAPQPSPRPRPTPNAPTRAGPGR